MSASSCLSPYGRPDATSRSIIAPPGGDLLNPEIENDLMLADAALAEARLMAREGMWKSAVNSSYNAGYFAALAAVKESGAAPKTHAAVRERFKERLIGKSGGMDASCAAALDALYEAKAETLRGPSVDWSREAVTRVVESAAHLVAAVQSRREGR